MPAIEVIPLIMKCHSLLLFVDTIIAQCMHEQNWQMESNTN